MQKYVSTEKTKDDVIAAHGPWSAMAIRLGPGAYTRDDQVDFRLRRLVQVAADAVGKPLSACRVLDLACLEGHYAIEFALQGAKAVGIELREANIAKAAFAAAQLKLDNVEFYMDDVNNLNAEQYGQFDIVICSGILYHLRGEDACALFDKIRACCTGILILDTYIAVHDRQTITVGGRAVHGSPYKEHEENADKLADLWASVDNEESFWLTEPSLLSVMQAAGFTTCAEIRVPVHPTLHFDRRAYLAYCGTPVELRSSEATQATASPDVPDRNPNNIHPSQRQRSLAFKLAKKVLPQNVKNVLKTGLRGAGLLDTKERPDFEGKASGGGKRRDKG